METLEAPMALCGSGIPSRFAIPCGTNRVGAPKALRRMCSAQSGSLLLGLRLFSLSFFIWTMTENPLQMQCGFLLCRSIKLHQTQWGKKRTKKARSSLSANLLVLAVCFMISPVFVKSELGFRKMRKRFVGPPSPVEHHELNFYFSRFCRCQLSGIA